ncbi:hypothetical protein [Shewanella xiamenensis]|uniref:hypothetical protein n=1 Tax=Shewanella xiamenensis TaxID=332186 RepID=UPI002E7BA5BD|nr:hypothetical protein [Shewanella xiamenensis]MEE1979726.1 hypothetical protein [Shewanella xiamenensis]
MTKVNIMVFPGISLLKRGVTMFWDKVGQQIFASKIDRIKVILWRLLLVSLALATTQNAMAFSGTLNFSGSDTTLGTTVNDGEANSTDIGGVVIEIYTPIQGLIPMRVPPGDIFPTL